MHVVGEGGVLGIILAVSKVISLIYRYPPKKKVFLPTLSDVGIFYLATRQIDIRQMRKEDKAKYNYNRIELYLKPKDVALFERKAKRYR